VNGMENKKRGGVGRKKGKGEYKRAEGGTIPRPAIKLELNGKRNNQRGAEFEGGAEEKVIERSKTHQKPKSPGQKIRFGLVDTGKRQDRGKITRRKGGGEVSENSV